MRFFAKLQTVAGIPLALALVSCGSNPQSQTATGTPSQFQPHVFALSVTANGSGTVTSSPTGIDCGVTCRASFAAGTTVVLTATPGRGAVFVGWSGVCSGTGPCSVPLNAAASVAAVFSASLQSVKHIIFMLQENRGFLHYFGALPEYWVSNGYAMEQFKGLPQFNVPPAPSPTEPGCDPTLPPPSQCMIDTNNPVPSFHLVTRCVENPSTNWSSDHHDFNFHQPFSGTATLDGFVVSAAAKARSTGFNDVNGMRAMGYYDGGDLNYYYFMASNFATSDSWFSPLMGDTQPNRMYLLAATSAGHAHRQATGSPTLNNVTIFELLQEAGISWKVYVTDPNPTLINGSAMSMFSFTYGFPQNFVPASQFISDAANGLLPQVAMIEPGYSDGRDEHPFKTPSKPGGNVQVGANYVSQLINALMHSVSWKDSVFILTWDESGGFYDDVPPQPTVSPDGIPPLDLVPGDVCSQSTNTGPSCDFVFTGYRLPLIVVSPYTKRHYVSHTTTDYTAILKFIETRFNLPSLTKRDVAQMDMTEFFDFAGIPWSTPPSPPTQNMTGPCVDTLP